MAPDTHMDDALQTLRTAAHNAGVSLPDGLRPQAVHASQFAGDPATELTKRLARWEYRYFTEHRIRFNELATLLSAEQVWDAFLAARKTVGTRFPTEQLLEVLMDHGLLPTGWTLFPLLTKSGDSELMVAALTAAVRVDDGADVTNALTPAAVVDLLRSGSNPVAAESVVRRAGEVGRGPLSADDMAALRSLVPHLTEDGMTKLVCHRAGRKARWATDEQVASLLAEGDLPHLALALHLEAGDLSLGQMRQAADIPGGLLLLSLRYRSHTGASGATGATLAQLLRELVLRNDSRLTDVEGDVVGHLFQKVDLTPLDDATFASLLHKSAMRDVWFSGMLPEVNGPTLGRVQACIAAGAVSARELSIAAAYPAATTKDWFAHMVRTLPGAGEMFAKMVRSSYQSFVDGMLPHVAAELGATNDEQGAELWHRLLSCAGGPFADLPIAEAAAVYRDRWAEAARRAR